MIRSVPDLALRKAGFDRFDHSAEAIDLLDVIEAALFHFVRQLFDEVGAAERIDAVDDARFVGNDLLRTQCNPRRLLGRKRECFVE